MNTLIIKKWRYSHHFMGFKIFPIYHLLTVLLLMLYFAPQLIYQSDPTAALPDAGIYMLLLLGFLLYFLVLLLVYFLWRWGLKHLGLPAISLMVSQFNLLSTWQQFVVYWASFALLLWGIVSCLALIC